LAALALLVTVLLLKSPVRVSGQLAADEPVTAAADAEVAGAADAHTGAGPSTPAAPGEVEDGSWLRRWEWHHRARLAMLFVASGGAVLLTAVSLVGGHETAEKRLTYQASVRSART